MGGLLLRRSGGAAGQDTAPMPITWQPAWLVHTERGDAGGGVAELGARLPLPAYGLVLGGGPLVPDATLEDLAAEYAQARDFMPVQAPLYENLHAVCVVLIPAQEGSPVDGKQ